MKAKVKLGHLGIRFVALLGLLAVPVLIFAADALSDCTPEDTSMLIDTYLNSYDFNEVNCITVRAPIADVYPVVRQLDFNDSRLTRILFKLRGLPFEDLSLDTLLKGNAFFILEESPPNEFVIGLLGDNGTPIKMQDAEQFTAFAEENSIKIAWNFYLREKGGTTSIRTETRVKVSGKKMKRTFSVYWFFIKPFSGLIRQEMLRLVKKQSEQ